MRITIAVFAFSAVFLVLDLAWLGVIARDFYREQMGALMASPIRLAPAVGFYLVYIAGVTYFVVAPALAAGDWRAAVLPGLFFGFVAYATYDLTNLAVVQGWPLKATFVDLAWGAIATCVSATAAAFLALKAA